MARTKAQVVSFLNSQVGQKVNTKCGIYNGQCVSLIKALLEYVGAPNPYAARGNAKDVGDTLLAQNIAESGKGQITVVVNRTMGNIGGVTYGHIWVDIAGVANYEQNGAVALHTTKNTRPLSQGQQFVNLDKWLQKENDMKIDRTLSIKLNRIAWYMGGNRPTEAEIKRYVGKDMGTVLSQIREEAQFNKQKTAIANYDAVVAENAKLKKQIADGGTGEFVPVGNLYRKKEG